MHCSRDVDTGSILSGPMTADGRYPSNVISLSDLMVCPPSWLKSQLTQVHSAQHDIEHAFELLPTETQMSYQDLLTIQQQFQNQMSLSSVSAPAYACEEIEDELEDQFWQEEELVHQNLMRNSRHTISNRRYGNSGYLAAGRMHARPSNNNNNASSSTVGAAGSSAAHANAKKNKNKKHKKEKQPIQDKRPENVALSVGRGGGTAVASMSLNSGQQQQCGTVVHNSSSMTENCSSWQSAMASCSNTQQQKTGGRKKKVKKKSRAGIAAARAAAENAQSSPSALTEA